MTDFVTHSRSSFDSPYQGSAAFFLYSGCRPSLDVCYSHQVIGSSDKPSLKKSSISSFVPCPSEAADGLQPSEDFFYSFSDPLADVVSFVPGRATINRRTASSLRVRRNVWGDLSTPHCFNKTMGIIALVSTDGRGLYALPRLAGEHLLGRLPFRVSCCRGNGDVDQEAVPVLHQGMGAEGEFGLLALALLHQTRLGISGGRMGLVRPLFAPEVHRGIARVIVCRRPVRRVFVLWPEALQAGTGLDQSTVHRKVIIREQPFLPGDVDHSVKELHGHPVFQKPIPVLRERRWIERSFFQVHVQEPAKEDVVIHHFAELGLGANRVQGDQELGLEQPLRRNRRPAHLAVHRVKDRRKLGKDCIRMGFDHPKGMLSRDPLFRRKVAEHPALNIVFTAHRASSSHQVEALYAVTSRLKRTFSANC